MNVTPMDAAGAHVPSVRRGARYVAVALAVAGAAVLVHAMVFGARLELLLVALGLAAGSALIGLLTSADQSGVIVRTRD